MFDAAFTVTGFLTLTTLTDSFFSSFATGKGSETLRSGFATSLAFSSFRF